MSQKWLMQIFTVQTLFISDLHLDPHHPASTAKFLSLLNRIKENTDALYILGDLFESWIGDDYIDPGYESVIHALSTLTALNVPVYVMRGNRDFLLGHSFAQMTGVYYLEDPCVIQLHTKNIILTHGDNLCTDDIDYQSFRTMVRNEDWQQQFLGKPIEERLAIAKQARSVSKTLNRNKPSDIMDVNLQAVEKLLDQHKASILIHGHTHRPGKYEMGIVERFVLGAWHDSATIVQATATGLSLETI